jgi:hypothetical protein
MTFFKVGDGFDSIKSFCQMLKKVEGEFFKVGVIAFPGL